MCEPGRILLLASALILCPCLLATADVVNRPRRSYGLGDLQAIALSPDGSRLASAGQSGAFLWDLSDGQVRHRLENHGVPVTAIAFSPDSELLLTGGRDGTVRMWTVDDGRELQSFKAHQREVSSLAWAPDGSMWVSASHDNYARVWSHPDGELVQSVMRPGEFYNAAIFTQDAAQLITADTTFTNNVVLWDLATGASIRVFGEHNGPVRKLVLLPDNRLATGGDDANVRIWGVETGVRERTLEGLPLIINGLVQGAMPDTLIAASLDGQVLGWDLTTGAVIHSLQTDSVAGLAGAPGLALIHIATAQNEVHVWDPGNGSILRTLRGHSTSATSSVAFSPDQRFVLSGGNEKSTRLWNRATGELIRTFDGQAAGTATAAFSPDGSRVLTTIGFPHKAARIWRTETGELEREFLGHTDWLTAGAFSRDGTRIVTGGDDRTARLWDVETGALLRTFTGHLSGIRSVAISPDGTLVAGGGTSFDPSVRLWNAASGQSTCQLEANAGTVTALSFSPAGSELLVAWEDGLIRLFAIDSGDIVREIIVPSAFLNAAVLSPDGNHILTGESFPFFAARLWETATGSLQRTFLGHTWSVNAVAFSSNGQWLLTGGDNIRLWDIRDLLTGLIVIRSGTDLEITWGLGTLEQAHTIHGPWEPAPEASSPWLLPAEGTARFYRVLVPEKEEADDGVR
jgi:WD40 repeat protein